MSGPTIDLVHARLTHVGPIAARMRDADRLECVALGRSPKGGLRIGLAASLRPITVLVDGRPEAMFGVVPTSLLGSTGIVWMLSTDRMYECGRALVLVGPRMIDAMLSDFRSLSNVVSAENARAIRFLRWLGFIVGGSVEMHGDVAFVPFHISRDSRR